MKKIAFCFMTYSCIDHEDIWRSWFNGIEKDKYALYITQSHPDKKTPVRYFKDNIIPSRETKYYNKSIVGCQVDMISAALKDEDVTHIIFLSGSHIPVKKFSQVYDNMSSTCLHDITPRNMDREFKVQGLIKHFRKLVKSSQWAVYTRDHAEDIAYTINNETLDTLCPRGKYDISAAPDEIILQSYLLSNYPEDEFNITQNDPENSPTFEYWNYNRSYKYNKHFTSTTPEEWKNRIKTYYIIEQEEIDHLTDDCSCLFMRKVSDNCVVLDYDNPRKDYERELNTLYIDLFTLIYSIAKNEIHHVSSKLLTTLNRIKVTTLTDYIVPKIT